MASEEKKTTILKLLSEFYRLTKGQIAYAKRKLYKEKKKILFSNVVLTERKFQKFLLFHSSVFVGLRKFINYLFKSDETKIIAPISVALFLIFFM